MLLHATATKIRFHFQFLRSPDAPFGGLIGWLFNWTCKFCCRMINNMANYLKYNYFRDGDGIDNFTLRKFSDFCSRHTVGVAGDDIMFHILVVRVVIDYRKKWGTDIVLVLTHTMNFQWKKKVPWNGAVSMRSRAGSWETLSICITCTRAFQLSTDTYIVDWWYSSVRPVRGPVARKFTGST